IGNFPHALARQYQIKGERYTMRYNDKDPEDIEVDYWHPVFEKEENTHFTFARISKIQKKNFFSIGTAIVYNYTVNERKIEKCIYLRDDYKILYPNLKEGQFYEVEFWDKNVYRGVIHLEKPILDTSKWKDR
ncbi:MAG: hypothetical protein H7257_10545, partial [Taibaiella sp.]|nr:hypothetical protein [Taibaiella sp.]